MAATTFSSVVARVFVIKTASGANKSIDHPITTDELIAFAASQRMNNFRARKDDGSEINAAELPYAGNLEVYDYNAPKIFSDDDDSEPTTFHAVRAFVIKTASGANKSFDHPIKVDELVAFAASQRMNNFRARKDDGSEINAAELPYAGNLEVYDYNAPKNL
jgi:putative IMPACT (imprinted ancient) family translation regulator